MNLGHHNQQQRPGGPTPAMASAGTLVAFTLLELMVVIAIIAIIAGLGLPAITKLAKPKGIAVADRQLLDDFALARSIALSSRSTVYVVFVPTNVYAFSASLYTNNDSTLLNELVAGQYTTYALYAKRSVGEQPGQEHPRYLTDWKKLPDSIYIPPVAFDNTNTFSQGQFHFPTTDSPNATLHYIAFNSQGQLLTGRDAVLPLTQGSIMHEKTNGVYVMAPADVQETPPGNWTNNYNHVRLSWLTGRGKIEKAEIQ